MQLHDVRSSGVDINAFTSTNHVVAEVWNWYGGCPHPSRFDSVVCNLMAYPDAAKYLFIYGARLTSQQLTLCNHLGIRVTYLPNQLRIPTSSSFSIVSKIVGDVIYSPESVVSSQEYNIESSVSNSRNCEVEATKNCAGIQPTLYFSSDFGDPCNHSINVGVEYDTKT